MKRWPSNRSTTTRSIETIQDPAEIPAKKARSVIARTAIRRRDRPDDRSPLPPPAARLRAEFAGRILATNRELLGLSETAELEFDVRTEGDDLLLQSHVRDIFGPCRITLRIERSGRLSAVRVHRPGW